MTVRQIATSIGKTYAIDTTHSELAFQVRHLPEKVRGRFADFGGTIRFDEQYPEHSSVSLTIDASSVETDTSDRDQRLRSADFFDVDTYPTITFTSSQIVRTSPEAYDIVGTLTIRGITQDVVLPVIYLGTATDPSGRTRAGFEGGITINWKDFGFARSPALEAGRFLVGDEVQISLSIQAIAE